MGVSLGILAHGIVTSAKRHRNGIHSAGTRDQLSYQLFRFRFGKTDGPDPTTLHHLVDRKPAPVEAVFLLRAAITCIGKQHLGRYAEVLVKRTDHSKR